MKVSKAEEPLKSKYYKEFYELELKILEYSGKYLLQTAIAEELTPNLTKLGLKESEYKYENVVIDQNGDFMHTLHTGLNQKRPLVLVHGWGGSNMTFYKILKPLSEHFRIYAVDLLGKGGSSRPDYWPKNPEEAIQFFVESFERWRIAMKLDKFTVVAHSMGAYMMAWHYLKYNGHLERILMLSPAGITNPPPGFSFKKWYFEQNIFGKMFYGFNYITIVSRINFFKYIPKLGPLGAYIIKQYLIKKVKFKTSSEEELNSYVEYLTKNLQMPESGHRVVFDLFLPRSFPRLPLEDIMKKEMNDLQIDFIYGETDWNEWQGAYRFAHEAKAPSKVMLLPKSGHHVMFDNPEVLAEYIIRDLLDINS